MSPCHCGETKTISENRTNKIGNPYIKVNCSGCGEHIKFLEADGDPRDFIIPFGKHTGKRLSEIYRIDKPYLEWISQNFDEGSIKNKILYVLAKGR